MVVDSSVLFYDVMQNLILVWLMLCQDCGRQNGHSDYKGVLLSS